MSWRVAIPVFTVGIFVGITFRYLSSQPGTETYLRKEPLRLEKPIRLEEIRNAEFHPSSIEYLELGPEFTEDSWWEQLDSERTLFVAPYTGLANTLQTIGSAFTIAYREKINIKARLTEYELDLNVVL